MQALITLDFGNTNPHAGLFQKLDKQWQLIKVVPWVEINIFLSQLNMTADNTSIALCEVKSREEELAPLLEQGFLLSRIKDYWRGERFHGMPVHYTKTLGEDRLINAYYAFKQEKVPTIIIDAGTFTTIDILKDSGFQGGHILPGIRHYFSLFSLGEQLKGIDLELNFKDTLPQNTKDAMTNGYQAFIQFAEYLIKEHQIKKLVLTGGDTKLWQEQLRLNTEIKIEIDPYYIHRAIHFWMTTQIEPL